MEDDLIAIYGVINFQCINCYIPIKYIITIEFVSNALQF